MDQDLHHLFENIYTQYKSAVYSYVCYLTKNSDEAEDLFQETWLRVAKNISTINTLRNIKAWIFTITTNLHRDNIRKRKIRQETWRMRNIYTMETGEERGGSYKSDPEEAVTVSETAKAILGALEKIPEKLQKIFVLKEMEGFSYNEISQILKVPVGTTKSRFHRAIKLLRRELAAGCLIPGLLKEAK